MSNPYQSPSYLRRDETPFREVVGPAISLIVVSIICLVFGTLGLALDVLFLVTGMVEWLEAMNEGPISEYTQITIRMIWGVVLLLASTYVFYGALKMKNMTDYGTAKAAAIVAVIPMVGPCCLLGIPFGIWALVVLSRDHVRDAFR